MAGRRRPKGTIQKWLSEQPLRPCACGCDEVIKPHRDHFYKGSPQYVLGHNSRVANPNPPLPRTPCACGCGAVPRTPGRRFLAGHNNRGQKRSAETRQLLSEGKRGARNPQYGQVPHNFKGSYYHRPGGYVVVHSPGHPFGGVKSVVFQHRLVVETHLRENDPNSPHLVAVGDGLYLSPEVEVHHINGVKDDNRVENLEPMTKAEHTAHHQALKRR